MNKQAKYINQVIDNVLTRVLVSRGIEWTHIFGEDSGATSNPIGGCLHGCKWVMPELDKPEEARPVAICYADAQVQRMQNANFYPNGFEHYYWRPEELKTWETRHRSGIFVGSMSDVFGHWVPTKDIQTILNACFKYSQHIYFFLTKNAPRLKEFIFPANVFVGVSVPPSIMWNQPLTVGQQAAMLHNQLNMLKQTQAKTRWMSVEPLSFDVAGVMLDWARRHWPARLPLEWMVIGAASNGSKTYQPDQQHLRNLLSLADSQRIPVFFKGNLKDSAAATPWREEYPVL